MYEKFKERAPYALLDTSKYPPEVAGRFNSFITTQFDDSLSVEMQMRSVIKWAIENFKNMDQTYNDFTEYVVQGNLNPFIEFLNDLIEYMNEFVDTFDTKFQEEILNNLQEWYNDGTLETLINDSLDTKYHEMDERLTTQLAQTPRVINVEEYGAVGDGVTDARPQLQEIIDEHAGSTPVDLYLPKGKVYLLKTMTGSLTPKTSAHILEVAGNISFVGEGTLKVADNFGEYYAILFWTSNGTSIRQEDITIDENSRGNPPVQDINNNPNWNRHVLRSPYRFEEIITRNVKIIDTNPVTTMIFQNVAHHEIDNNYIEYSQTVEPPVKYDNSAIWHCGETGHCRNNTIIGNNKAVSAIEVHGENTITEGNIINNFDQGVLVASDFNTGQNMVVNNIIRNVRNGIVLWTDEGMGCRDIVIEGNNIFLSPNGPDSETFNATNANYAGITTRNVTNTQIHFEKWKISNNTIAFDSRYYRTSKGGSAGIQLVFISLHADSNKSESYLENLVVENNTILNSYETGISVHISISFNPNKFSNFIFKQNTIINPFYNFGGVVNVSNILDNSGSGFYIFAQADVHNWLFKDNHIIIECEEDFKGSHTNKLFEFRHLYSRGTDTVKVINNTHSINTPLLVNTLDSTQIVLFEGLLAEKDLNTNPESPTFLLEGSIFNTQRVGQQHVTTQRINNISIKGGDKKISGTGNANDLNYKGYWKQGQIIRNRLYDGTNVLEWVCTKDGVVVDKVWSANTYFEAGELFKHASYPNKIFIVKIGGNSGSVFTPPDGANNTLNGSVVFQILEGDITNPEFSQISPQ